MLQEGNGSCRENATKGCWVLGTVFLYVHVAKNQPKVYTQEMLAVFTQTVDARAGPRPFLHRLQCALRNLHREVLFANRFIIPCS